MPVLTDLHILNGKTFYGLVYMEIYTPMLIIVIINFLHISFTEGVTASRPKHRE